METEQTDECPVRVGTHWAQLWLMAWFLGAPVCVAAILWPLVAPFAYWWFAVLIVLVCMIATWAAPIVLWTRLPPSNLRVDEHGVVAGRRGQLTFDEIASYDSSVLSYGTRGRMYLVLRPRSGASLIIRPVSRARCTFARLCEQLAVLARQREQAGFYSPTWRSFWGSRRAKWMGAGGMALILVVVIEALLLAPRMAFYAVGIGATGAPIFIGMMRGKRPFS